MENQSFIKTVSKYPAFLASISLGVFLAVFGWIRPMLKTRTRVGLFVAVLVGAVMFVALTVRAMLQLG